MTVQSSGMTLVFIHGYLDGPAAWQRLLDLLPVERLQAKCVSLNAVAAPHQTSAQLLEAYALQVVQECDDIPKDRPVVLIGHSMGACVAELAAASLPSVVGLILITPAPLRGTVLPAEVMARFTARAGLVDREEIRKGKTALAIELDDEAQDILADATLSTGGTFALEQLESWTGGHPAGLAPSEVNVPVQIVATDDKFFTSALLEQESARFSNVEIKHVSGAGHWPQLEHPAQLAQCMAPFLAKVSEPLSTA